MWQQQPQQPPVGMAVPVGHSGMVATAQPVAYPQPMMAQPMMAQPVMAQPVMGQPMMAQQPMVVQQVVQQPMAFGSGERLPPGAPPGGSWTVEPFIGPTTLVAFIVLLFLFWPACAAPFCCPCDQRARRPNPPPISG